MTLYQFLLLAALTAFVVFLFRGSPGSRRRGSSMTRSARPKVGDGTTSAPRSGEVQRLHEELLALVYGDEKLLERLVDYERRTQSTREACYRAAINRLVRDRAN